MTQNPQIKRATFYLKETVSKVPLSFNIPKCSDWKERKQLLKIKADKTYQSSAGQVLWPVFYTQNIRAAYVI